MARGTVGSIKKLIDRESCPEDKMAVLEEYRWPNSFPRNNEREIKRNILRREGAMKRLIVRFGSAVIVSLIWEFLVFGQGINVTLLHVNDTHSHLDSFGPKDRHLDGTLGGIAKAAAVIGQAMLRP